MTLMSKRLAKDQKIEIVEAYRAGQNTNDIAEKYSCSSNTINRTVKALLSSSEYRILKEKRLKINSKNEKSLNNKLVKDQNLAFEDNEVDFNSNTEEVDDFLNIDKTFDKKIEDEIKNLLIKDSKNLKVESASFSSVDEKINSSECNQDLENNFEEIAPLLSNYDFNLEKKNLNIEIQNHEILPESVYMIVDKKVELESQSISELPEWSFLPENELKRNAILLFPNQRSAKRSCSRNQRVIKIPNTSVFKVSKSYLVSKGITRLILEDSIIALDK